MQSEDKFRKISWVYEIPEVYLNGNLCASRLEQLSEDVQKRLVLSVVTTLARYFGGMHHYVDGLSLADAEYENKCKLALNRILPVWLSGLCDVSASQIIHGLLDILNLKTEYQKWPPKSVIEFHAVCKMTRPAYHDRPRDPSNAPQLEWDKKAARQKTVKTAHECLIKIYRQLKGKDYLEVHEQKKKDGVYGKEVQEEWEKEYNCSLIRRAK
jgi:hypothetical protein